jgi:transposase
MSLYYAALDLHSNRSVLVLIDEEDRVVWRGSLPNDLELVLMALVPYREQVAGVAVESTYNWYWLVDGLMAAGYPVHLANTAAIVQYAGLKYTDDPRFLSSGSG